MSVWLEDHLAFNFFFSHFKLWKSLEHGMLGRHPIWEGLPSEAVWGFLSALFLHWALFQRGLSLFSLQWHLLAPLGHKDSTMRGSHQPQGSPSVLGNCKCCCITSFRACQQFLCNRVLLQKAAENNIVDLCARYEWSKNMRVHVWPNTAL